MDKVICNNCGEIFEEDRIIYDGEDDMEYCPYCHEGGRIGNLCIEDFLILSEDAWGDRGIMPFNVAKKKIYDIAFTKDAEGCENFLLQGMMEYAKYIELCFKNSMLNNCRFEYMGTSYSLLDNKKIEELWDELEDITFIEDGDSLVLLEDWFIFDKGTEITEIWTWFDRYHCKGVGWLMNEY